MKSNRISKKISLIILSTLLTGLLWSCSGGGGGGGENATKNVLSNVTDQLEADLVQAGLSPNISASAKVGAQTAASSMTNDLLNVIPAAFDGAFDTIAAAGLNDTLLQTALSTIIDSLLSNIAGQESLVSVHSSARIATLPTNFSSLLTSLTTRIATKAAKNSSNLQTLTSALIAGLGKVGATATEIETTYVSSIVQTATTVVMSTTTDKTTRDSVLSGLGVGIVAGAQQINTLEVNVATIQTATTNSMNTAAVTVDSTYDVSTATNAVVTAVNTESTTSIINETTPASCTLNGQSVGHGSNITAYQASSVAFGGSCVSEIRNCSNGTLSGSYNNSSCSVAAAAACTLNGQNIASGLSVTAYKSASVSFGNTCTSEVRNCSNGTLSGSYTQSSCTVAPAACSFNGQTVAEGSTITAYQTSSVDYGSTCASESRSCSNGILNGSYTNTSCSVAAAANCSFSGQTISHGGNVTAYQTPSVDYGSTCSSQMRSCSNGNLSGSYAYTSCTVSSAIQSSSDYSANGTTFKITVRSSGYSNKYYVDGTETKSLSLKEGYTYYFNVEDSSTNNHPLFVGTTSGGGNYSNEYSSGVTYSRATNGTLTFTVPTDAPSTLYYNCGLHSSMGGLINIVESD